MKNFFKKNHPNDYLNINSENRDNLILKIKSIHNIRLLFSYIEDFKIINLIKINKSLQNKLGIKILIYYKYTTKRNLLSTISKYFNFFSSEEKNNKENIQYFLTEFLNIKIKNYLLPDNFEKIENKINYLYLNKYEYEIEHSKEELKLISKINEIWKNKKSKVLTIDYHFPKFIFNISFGINYIKNIHEIEKENGKYGQCLYIFKYNQKEKEFNNLENSLEKILINENYNYLNSINVIKINEDDFYVILSYEGSSDYVLKYTFFGDDQVGKTNILCHFAHNQFFYSYKDYYQLPESGKKTIVINNKIFGIYIYDINTKNFGVGKVYYKGTRCCLVVYDISNRFSFNKAIIYIKEIINNYYYSGIKEKALKILVGNKSDLEDKRQVTKEEGKELADKNGFLFYEISSKNGTNLSKMFFDSASIIAKRISENYYKY